MALFDIETIFGKEASILREFRFQILLFCNINSALGTVMVSPMLAELATIYGISEVQTGLLVAAYSAPGIVIIPLVGVVTDRIGRKRVLVTSLLLFGVAGSALALTDDFRVALALRVLQGVGFSGILPVIITLIGDTYRGPRENTAQGVRFASSGIIQATVPILAGALIIVFWRLPFLIYSLAFPAAIFTHFGLDEPSIDEGTNNSRRIYLRHLAYLSIHPRVLGTLLALIVPSLAYGTFIAYNSILVRFFGGSPTQAGVLVTVASGVYAAAASQAGRFTAWFGGREIIILIACVSTSGGLVLFSLAPTFLFAAGSLMFLGFGTGLAFSLTRSALTEMASTELRGGIVGIGEAVIRLGNSVAPILTGALIAISSASFGFQTAVRIGLGIIGASGLILAVIASGLMFSFSAPTKI